jgi:hypothetical protein
MSTSQSRANRGVYDDRLPAQYWKWPQGTWFQERLSYVSKNRKATKEAVQRIRAITSEHKTGDILLRGKVDFNERNSHSF